MVGNSVRAFSRCYCQENGKNSNQGPVPAQSLHSPPTHPAAPVPLCANRLSHTSLPQISCHTLFSLAHLFLDGHFFSGVLVSRITSNQVRGPDLWGKVWENMGESVKWQMTFCSDFSGGQVWTPDCQSSPLFMSTLPWLQQLLPPALPSSPQLLRLPPTASPFSPFLPPLAGQPHLRQDPLRNA